MKREWIKVGVTVALVLFVNAGLTHWYVSTVLRGNVAIRTEVQFDDYRAGLKTLILGDSHSKWGVDARLLDSAFNAALPGQSYMHDYYLLRSYVERGLIAPQFLIIGVDLHSFTERPGSKWGFLHFYARHIDYLEEGWRRRELFSFGLRQLQGRFAPYVAQRDNILHYLASGRPLESEHLLSVPIERGSIVSSGWYHTLTSEKRRQDAMRKAAIRLRGRDAFDARHVEDFLRLLDLCRERKIRVLLVQFPQTAEYLAAATHYVDIDAYDRRVAQLLKGRTGVAVLHARTQFADRPELFMDATHLHSGGAEHLAVDIKLALSSLAAQPW